MPGDTQALIDKIRALPAERIANGTLQVSLSPL